MVCDGEGGAGAVRNTGVGEDGAVDDRNGVRDVAPCAGGA